MVRHLTYAEYATRSYSCAMLLRTAHTQLRISAQRIRSLASIALGAVGPDECANASEHVGMKHECAQCSTTPKALCMNSMCRFMIRAVTA